MTYPLYYLICQPWKKTINYGRKRTEQVGSFKSDEVIYRAIPYTSPCRDYIIGKNLDTMDKIWKHSVLKHQGKRCLGTRKIIEEKIIPDQNGKPMTKLVKEPFYKWISYEEADQKSTNIGRLVFALIQITYRYL